jgi:photosystem II stability/assembly factor-like uncharacterized protein
MAIYPLSKRPGYKILRGLMAVGVAFFVVANSSLLSSLGSRPVLAAPSSDLQTADQPANLQDFGLISDTDGWVLVSSQLYWTADHAASWTLITPVLPPAAAILAVKFLDANIGWVLWSTAGTGQDLVLHLERTSDAGRHWMDAVIQVLPSDDPNSGVQNASMDWLDENTGWVSIKHPTGSNFSSGTLFQTLDGGQTWVRLSLPIGEPVYFVDRQLGWTSGGPAGDQLFKTQDAGKTWEKQPVPGDSGSSRALSVYLPVFDSPQNGLLPVVAQTGSDFQLEIYATHDGGQSWGILFSYPLGPRVGRLPVSRSDPHGLGLVIPFSQQVIQVVDHHIQTILDQDSRSDGIVDLRMLAPDFGWARWNNAACSKQAASNGLTDISCTTSTQLIETRDGGVTWESLLLPGNPSGPLVQSFQSTPTSQAQGFTVNRGKTLLFTGQGFDKCEITTLPNLQEWWNFGPYQTVNLYIGGASRSCPNTALTASYVSSMRQQGWAFIPTWVGPQAPCTLFKHTFSADVTTAFSQGVNEANLAVNTLAALGLTNSDKTGSVVYYDMEAYGSVQSCRNAANAFINGWVTRLHELGITAGVYGSTLCSTALSDYLTIPNVPDVIWPALWYLPAPDGTYDPSATVWDLGKCLPNTVWNAHQRIRQYAGDHAETWGDVTLGGIDDNVLDGVVAVPYLGTPSPLFSAALQPNHPLGVKFTILNTAFLATCAWNYGDGQTGTSCSYGHSHTYAGPGTYTVSLTVNSFWGTENLTSRISITVGPQKIYIPIITW